MVNSHCMSDVSIFFPREDEVSEGISNLSVDVKENVNGKLEDESHSLAGKHQVRNDGDFVEVNAWCGVVRSGSQSFSSCIGALYGFRRRDPE